MESKDELALIEQERNGYRAIEYLQQHTNKNIDIYLRVIFILLDFLVEGKYTQEEHDFISLTIKKVYNEALKKYSNNNDFLFFSGVMIYIAEWYFGMDNIDKATSMLHRAMQSNPENIIYRWGYVAIVDQRVDINTETKFLLSKEILENISTLEWIKNKGLLGEYLLGIIQATYDSTRPIP